MAEAELNTLRKLEANKTCVNCDAYSKFGHQNICEKFKTFVCSNCKSAHQSYSMRVKSVTMSNWTKEEVDALKESNGGGNAVGRRVWLGRWDESKMRKPVETDHIDYFKRFIDKVYNERAFYDEDGLFQQSGGARKAATSVSKSAPVPAPAAPAAPTSKVNLLDFAAPAPASSSSNTGFDAFAAPSNGGSSDGWADFAKAPASTSSNSGFNDGFGDFATAPAAPASTSSSASFDPFGASSFSAAPSSSSSSASSFDPFGATSTSTNFSAPAQAPMSNGNTFGAAPSANFSAFDALSAPPAPGSGMGMGMNHRGGMNHGGMNHGGINHGGMHHGGMNHHGGMHQGGMNHGMMNQQGMHHQGMGGMHQSNGMGMGMGMGMPPNSGGFVGGGSAAISNLLDPNRPQPGAYGRPNGGAPAGRDPFAGLGLPH
ncbi:TPA: hypothetical protein N0F65_000781 [Lagenidium giganteum]|uniref:Arf-GAP domain-containing protein n=1 Tax=Lagenidium giganteum TaxID=4803 RepID=A0AAV2ZDQ7_9STRA|nr:TPA: hypothetical protein N0F65_000781 [Lagenidium giganteum]